MPYPSRPIFVQGKGKNTRKVQLGPCFLFASRSVTAWRRYLLKAIDFRSKKVLFENWHRPSCCVREVFPAGNWRQRWAALHLSFDVFLSPASSSTLPQPSTSSFPTRTRSFTSFCATPPSILTAMPPRRRSRLRSAPLDSRSRIRTGTHTVEALLRAVAEGVMARYWSPCGPLVFFTHRSWLLASMSF